MAIRPEPSKHAAPRTTPAGVKTTLETAAALVVAALATAETAEVEEAAVKMLPTYGMLATACGPPVAATPPIPLGPTTGTSETYDEIQFTLLNVSLSRQSDALSDAQIQRNVKQAALQQQGGR